MAQLTSTVKRNAERARSAAEISNTPLEQTGGSGDVTEAVSQLDEVTQRSAALVEQSAAASASLQEQAGRLMESVSNFKLECSEALQKA